MVLNALLLKVILARATSLAAGERTFVVSLASMNTNVSSKMSRRSERLGTRLADMVSFLLDGGAGSRNVG